jgi:UDP-2-acetamido-3-amino-2,3-dideoxy-glucuronate N-acetyltransferase
LRSSEPDEHTLQTLVREGATIGANCTVGNDLTIGRFAMVGMGSVVTKSVPDFHLVLGQPARTAGFVCRCGQMLMKLDDYRADVRNTVTCRTCDRPYLIEAGEVTELELPSR